jgi:hypothetical protein
LNLANRCRVQSGNQVGGHKAPTPDIGETTAMPVLNVHLISHFSYDGENIGEGGLYQTGLHLIDFFNEAVAESKSFSGSDFWYNPDAGQVGPKDLVCYMLPHSRRSIVAKHTSDPLGPAGSTAWSQTSQAMISEIYMDATAGDPSRPRLLANLIIHELMHNKLDTHPSKAVLNNVHSIAQGRVSTAGSITSSSTPSPADVKAMRRSIDLSIAQHTGDFVPWTI